MAFINNSVGNNMANRAGDVLNIKNALRALNQFDEDVLTGYITRGLDNSIRGYQRDNGLKEDGILFPGGETETALTQSLERQQTEDRIEGYRRALARIRLGGSGGDDGDGGGDSGDDGSGDDAPAPVPPIPEPKPEPPSKDNAPEEDKSPDDPKPPLPEHKPEPPEGDDGAPENDEDEKKKERCAGLADSLRIAQIRRDGLDRDLAKISAKNNAALDRLRKA